MRKTLEQRFWEKVDKRGDDECWEWKAGMYGTQTSVPYGRFYITRTTPVSAHVQSYRLVKGMIPAGMHVCHTCDNGRCCNPGHLFLGSSSDNMQDMRRKGRGKNEGWKLSKEDVYSILGQRFDEHRTLKKIATVWGLTVSGVNHITRGRRHPEVYEKFMAARELKAA